MTGLIMVDGPLFREQRRFTARHLRELGFGKTSMEDSIHEEIRDLIELIRKQSKSNPKNIVDFEGIFNFFNLNVLWTLIGGERFSLNDARVAHLLDIIAYFHRHFKPLTSSLPVPKCLLQIFPWLRKTLGVRNDIFQPLQDFIRVNQFFRRLVFFFTHQDNMNQIFMSHLIRPPSENTPKTGQMATCLVILSMFI